MSIKKTCNVVDLIKTLEILYKKGWSLHKIFGHLKFGKMKKGEKIKKSIFDSPLNQTFSQTEFIIAKSEFAHIKHFQ